ncbi:MAG: hypothetical protein QXJ59_06420 [Thermofilaceae archaeon]
MESEEEKRDEAASTPAGGVVVAYTEKGAKEHDLPSLRQFLKERLGVRKLLVAEEWWVKKGAREGCTVYDVVFLVLFRGGEAKVKAECCRDDERGKVGEQLAVCRIISVRVRKLGRLKKLFS